MSSTVRFSQLVEKSGKPRLHLIWGEPEKDRDFQRALKTCRVLTIHQENVGTKKDFGIVGFSKDGPAQFLVFPRSLKAFQDRRVVGVNYSLFEEEIKPRQRPLADVRPARTKAPETAPHKKLWQEEKAEDSAKKEDVPAAAKPAAPSLAQVFASDHKPAAQDQKSKSSRGKGAGEEAPIVFDRRKVLKEIRAVLSALEAGKTVAAFQRLEKVAQQLDQP